MKHHAFPACADARALPFLRLPLVLALSTLGLLTACGGGGDDAAATAATLAAATEAAAPVADAGSDAAGTVDAAIESDSTMASIQALQLGSTGQLPAATATYAALPTPVFVRTVYVNPANAAATDTGTGSYSQPYRTIGAAMAKLQPGDDVVISAGTYREQITVPSRNWGSAYTRIRAATPHTVKIKGSAAVGGWTSAGNNVYYLAWSGEEPEQVYRAGKPLKQIGGTVFSGFPLAAVNELNGMHASEGGVWPGRVAGGVSSLQTDSFTWDAANRRVYVKLASALAGGEQLEVSNRRHGLQAEAANNLIVQGLDFAHSNTSYTYRQGAVKVVGNNNWLDDLVVQNMDAACVQLIGTGSTLSNSIIQNCGQIGISGRGRSLTIRGNQVVGNNTRGFNKWWEAGGMKLTGTGSLHDSVIAGNLVANNNGDGIWIDWKNTNNRIEGNTTAYNSGFGIHYEASQTGTIRNNWSYGNGARGIYLLESSYCVVEGNSVFSNRFEGIAIVNGWRSASDAMLMPYGNQTLRNTIAWNDIGRNYINLVLPGTLFQSRSDYNALASRSVEARLSMGFMTSTNYPYEKLRWWVSGTGLDAHSTTSLIDVPAAISDALAAKRLLTQSELPAWLARGGAAY